MQSQYLPFCPPSAEVPTAESVTSTIIAQYQKSKRKCPRVVEAAIAEYIQEPYFVLSHQRPSTAASRGRKRPWTERGYLRLHDAPQLERKLRGASLRIRQSRCFQRSGRG